MTITAQQLTTLEGRINTLATLAVQLSPQTAQPVVDEVYAAIADLKQSVDSGSGTTPIATNTPAPELEEIL